MTTQTSHLQRHKPLALDLAWPYEVRLLGPDSIPDMLALQERAGDNEIIPKSAEDIERHFAQGHYALGVIHDGRLVGQAMIRQDYVSGHDMGLAFAEAAQAQRFRRSTMGCVVIAPEARGRGLIDMLLKIWLEKDADCDFAHARVRVGNVRSWEKFLGRGLCITGVGPSPDDPTRTVYTLHKPMGSGFDLKSG